MCASALYPRARIASQREVTNSVALRCSKHSAALSLPSLSALTLLDFQIADTDVDTVTQRFVAAAARLEVLLLFESSHCLLDLCVPKLLQLRVLVLDKRPSAATLVPLKQLQYLHFDDCRWPYVPENQVLLGLVLRWLSIHHALRSVSISDKRRRDLANITDALYGVLLPPRILIRGPWSDAAQKVLAQLHPPIDTVAKVAPGLTDLSTEASLLPWHFTWLSKPGLYRLQTALSRSRGYSFSQPMLAALRELRLAFVNENDAPVDAVRDSSNWRQMESCTQLRVLQLSAPCVGFRRTKFRAGLHQVAPILRASAATLETISLGNLQLNTQKSDDDWTLLAQCQQLRSLSLTMQPLAWASLLGALSHLPWFHTLGLFIESAVPALPAGLLRHMTTSPSWRTVQLQLLNCGCPITLLQRCKASALVWLCPPAEALSDEAAAQVRFIVSKRGHRAQTHFIVIDEEGRRAWYKM